MADILNLITSTSTMDVEACGLWWRVRKVKTSDLFAAGVAELAVSAGSNPAESNRRVSPKDMIDQARISEAAVCAALVAGSTDGSDWQPLTVVMDERKADPTARVLYVGLLPAGVVEVLARAVMSLSTDGGAAAERLAAFRVQAEPRAARGRAR